MQEVKGSEMRSTFPISMLNRRDHYHLEEKRIALVGREALHNAAAQNAAEAFFFNFGKDAKEYLVIAHNGNPFKNTSDLRECMKPSVTGGEGVQGNGMKASMFLSTENNDESELVIHSHSKFGIFTSRLTCVNFNDAKIEDVSKEWNDEIKSVMGELYDQFTVLYIYRYVNAYTRENKEGRRFTNGLLTPSHMRLMAELSPSLFDKVRVRASYNLIYGKLCKYKEIGYQYAVCPSSSKVDADFCTDTETFKKQFSVEIDGVKQQFEGIVDILVYPNLSNNFARPIVLNGPETGEARCEQKHSAESLFVSCDFEVKDCKKDLTRATSDPYYTSVHNYDLLATLGLFCRKGRKFDTKLVEHWSDFLNKYNLNVDENNHGVIHWEPVVKVRVRLVPKNKDSIFAVGGLNEFFHADDAQKVRGIVAGLFQEIAEQNPSKLIALRERMKKHYPYDRSDDLAPIMKDVKLSADRNINVLEEHIDKDGNKSWKIIRNFNPGDHANFVKLEYSNGKPVLDAIHNVTGGVCLRREGDNTYTIDISPLVRLEDDGKKKVPVTAEEYRHVKEFLPKKIAFCDIGSDNYCFSFRINIPKREISGSGGPNSKAGIDNRSSEIDPDAYQEMAEALFGIYSNGKLILNKNNATILQMASFNREEHPSFYSRWISIYEKATKIARQSHVTQQELLEVDYYKSKKTDSNEKYGTPEQCFVNSHLRIVFESDEALALLNDVNQTKQTPADKAA